MPSKKETVPSSPKVATSKVATSKKKEKTDSKEKKTSVPEDLIDSSHVEPLETLKHEIHQKSTLSSDDILNIELVLKNTSDKLEKVCNQIKNSNYHDIHAEYSSKDKKCIISATLNIAEIVKSLEMKRMQDHKASMLRDKFFDNLGHENHKLLVFTSQFPTSDDYTLPTYMSPNDMSQDYVSPNLMQSSPTYPLMNVSPHLGGGQYLGNVNGCPNNSRLVYDAEGVIACNNPINQGGQTFLYPKKISACVGGGSKKGKLSKKNKMNKTKKGSGHKFCQDPPPTGSCPDLDMSYSGNLFCSPPKGNDGLGCTKHESIPNPPVSYPLGFPPDMNKRLPAGVTNN